MSLVIGLTGGIASGKSTVSNMLKEIKITVIDADVEARLAVQKGEHAYAKIIDVFSHDILLPNEELNRQKLGSIIFHDAEKRQQLNEIVHPEVRKRMQQKIEKANQNHEEIVVLDIPLLFESKLTYMVDKTLLVYVDKSIQLQRLMERNNLTATEAEARVNSQMPLSEKVILADAVIDNNGSIEETKEQLNKVFMQWNLNKNII